MSLFFNRSILSSVIVVVAVVWHSVGIRCVIGACLLPRRVHFQCRVCVPMRTLLKRSLNGATKESEATVGENETDKECFCLTGKITPCEYHHIMVVKRPCTVFAMIWLHSIHIESIKAMSYFMLALNWLLFSKWALFQTKIIVIFFTHFFACSSSSSSLQRTRSHQTTWLNI